jgi:hypothetical protein
VTLHEGRQRMDEPEGLQWKESDHAANHAAAHAADHAAEGDHAAYHTADHAVNHAANYAADGKARLPAAVLPHPAIACADAEDILEPAHALVVGGAAQHHLLQPLLEALAVPCRVHARRDGSVLLLHLLFGAVLLVQQRECRDCLLALDIGELVLDAEEVALHEALFTLDVGEFILHAKNPLLQIQKELQIEVGLSCE